MAKLQIVIFESIHSSGIEILQSSCNVQVALGLPRAEILRLSKSSDAIVVKSVVRVDKELIDLSPRLKVIGRAGTGLENIDVDYAIQRNKRVLNVPTGNTVSAAEFAVLQMLLLCRRIPEVFDSVAKGDFRRGRLEGRELMSMTVGLVGLGNVGIEVARRVAPFRARMIAFDKASRNWEEFQTLGGLEADSLEELAVQADLISLHATLSSSSEGLLNDQFFNAVKPGLLLINTARGGMVNEDSVIRALNNGRLSFFATDFTDPEPPFDLAPAEHQFSHSFLSHPRISVTPHLGASTIEAQERIAIDLANQILSAL